MLICGICFDFAFNGFEHSLHYLIFIQMKKINLKPLIFAAFAFLLFSCEGDPGPMGPPGEQGLPGNANVTPIIFDVAPNEWYGDVNSFYANLDELPEITEDILNNGAVLVYVLHEENPNEKSFNMLPYTYVDGSSYEYMDFEAYIGRIRITLKWTDNGVNTTAQPTQLYSFKVVIIRGIPLATLKKSAPIHDYEATMKYLKEKAYKLY